MLVRRSIRVAWIVFVLLPVAALAQDDPAPQTAPTASQPTTRRQALRQQREKRARTVHPYEAGNLERLLAQLENEQTIENLFDVPSPSSGGGHLTLGNITTGAGLTLGTGYSGRAILGRQLELSVRGAVSQRLHWKGEAEMALPRLASGRRARSAGAT